jgi:hypothetical protein
MLLITMSTADTRTLPIMTSTSNSRSSTSYTQAVPDPSLHEAVMT